MNIVNLESSEGQKPSDPWLNPADTAKEIKNRHQPVDYAQMLADNRVLFLAENHGNHPIRHHLAQHARDIKAAGITHYAIEANEAGNAVFERLNRGEAVDLSKVDVGPGRADYETAIRALAAQGIQVVAIDIDQKTKPSKEAREACLTENINRLLEVDSNSKVAVLIGGFHTTKYYVSEGVPSVGRRLMEELVPAVNVHFAGGEAKGPTILTGAVSKAGLAHLEFMIDFRPYANLSGVPFGKGGADWVVHLPQQVPSLGSRIDFGRFS
ncbi:hypothetical protein HYU95_03465 [Candidatus Daviesbacteria bacterium]|nr:hypothetical protein [Candidatus Daviesbacteria bacterium]